MTDPWLIALAAVSALFVSGLVLWRRLTRVRRKPRPTKNWRQEPEGADAVQGAEPHAAVEEPDKLRFAVILFRAESASLSPAAAAVLSEIARRLTDQPELTIMVEGSADSSGNSTRNLVLARDRAWAAREFLLSRGITPERIQSVVKPPRAGRTEYERQRLRSVRLTWETT
jgi:outer membrane protein OmpA-like peptidoglycan-associated protein